MVTPNWSTLSWNKLMSPEMIGQDILIIYYGHRPDDLEMTVVHVIGPDYVGNTRVMVVDNPKEDDIFLITREGKGHLWDCYEIKEGF